MNEPRDLGEAERDLGEAERDLEEAERDLDEAERALREAELGRNCIFIEAMVIVLLIIHCFISLLIL